MDNLKSFKELFESAGENTVKFKRWTCTVEKEQYSNDRIALELIDVKNGETVLVATVNIPQEKIAKDEVIIKNYSENEGILDILVKANVISKPIRMIDVGMAANGGAVCKILI